MIFLLYLVISLLDSILKNKYLLLAVKSSNKKTHQNKMRLRMIFYMNYSAVFKSSANLSSLFLISLTLRAMSSCLSLTAKKAFLKEGF